MDIQTHFWGDAMRKRGRVIPLRLNERSTAIFGTGRNKMDYPGNTCAPYLTQESAPLHTMRNFRFVNNVAYRANNWRKAKRASPRNWRS